MGALEKLDVIGATRRAETIRSGMVGYAAAMEAIGEAYEARDWVALGHKTWDEYCEKEFSEKRLKLTQQQREQAVLAFRGAGMSIRAIGSALGLPKSSVADTLTQVSEPGHLPAEVTGADGKTYTASRPAPAEQPEEDHPDGPGDEDDADDATSPSDAQPRSDTGPQADDDRDETEVQDEAPRRPSAPVDGQQREGAGVSPLAAAPAKPFEFPDVEKLRQRGDLNPEAVEEYARRTAAHELGKWHADFTAVLVDARKALRRFTPEEITEKADPDALALLVELHADIEEKWTAVAALKLAAEKASRANVIPLRSVS